MGPHNTTTNTTTNEKTVVTIVTPLTRAEAKAQPEWPHWHEAEKKEMASQKANASWALTELPEGRKEGIL